MYHVHADNELLNYLIYVYEWVRDASKNNKEIVLARFGEVAGLYEKLREDMMAFYWWLL